MNQKCPSNLCAMFCYYRQSPFIQINTIQQKKKSMHSNSAIFDTNDNIGKNYSPHLLVLAAYDMKSIMKQPPSNIYLWFTINMIPPLTAISCKQFNSRRLQQSTLGIIEIYDQPACCTCLKVVYLQASQERSTGKI